MSCRKITITPFTIRSCLNPLWYYGLEEKLDIFYPVFSRTSSLHPTFTLIHPQYQGSQAALAFFLQPEEIMNNRKL